MTTFARALRSPVLGLVAAAAVLGGFSAGSALSSARMKGPTAVGIVDLERLLPTLNEINDVNKANESRAASMQKDVNALKSSFDNIMKELETISKTDTQARLEKFIQAQEAKAAFESKFKIAQTKLSIERGQFLRPFYKKIQDACAKLAADQQLDLIILDDRRKEIPDDESLTDGQVTQIIKDKHVLYAGKAVDITDNLTTQMNNEYAAGKR